MNITIKDVAKVANVSYSTVSRALSGSNQVSEETRKRILDICKKVGYMPNAMARSLVTNINNTIGLIVPDIANPFYSEVAYAVENEAQSRGYTVFLCNTNFEKERTETYFKLLMEKRVEGIIVASASEEIIQLIKQYHKIIPIIHIGSMPGDEEISYVTTDNVKAGYTAANYLLELGHRKIAFVGGTGVSNSYRERLRGFKLAMEDKQVVPDIELIRNYDVNKRESGYKITKLMIREKNIPTAIIAANDLVALGVIEACDELGLRIPEDISVIGFDDIPYASLPKVKLTTVAQLKYDLGRIAVETIFKSQKTDLANNIFKEILQPQLIIRSTCKKI